MDRIKVGDLVAIVRPSPCCGSVESVGKIFKVEGMKSSNKLICKWCDAIEEGIPTFIVSTPSNGWVRLSRLKKIEPLGNETCTEVKELANDCP